MENVIWQIELSPNLLDVFYRLKVWSPFTLFDSKLLHDKSELVRSEIVSWAGASSVHQANDANVLMSVTSTGEYVIRQTKMSMNYQPWKAQEILFTWLLSNDATTTSKIWYFNSSTTAPYTANETGLYFKSAQWVMSVNVANDGTVDSILSSNWNYGYESVPATAPFTVDWSTIPVLFIAFERLSAWDIVFGVIQDNKPKILHVVRNKNTLTNPYIKSPNQVIRYEIRSNTGAWSMKHICSTAISNGWQQKNGVLRTVNMWISGVSVTAGDYVPLIALRLKAWRGDQIVLPVWLSVLLTTKANFIRELAIYRGTDQVDRNGTLTAFDDITFTAKSNSCVEYKNDWLDTDALNTEYLDTNSWYVPEGGSISINNLESAVKIWSSIDGSRDVLVLKATPLAWSNTMFGSLDFRELDGC